MAAGFTPKHTEDYPIHDSTKERFLVAAHQAATKLNWSIAYLSSTGFIAYTDNGMFSFNAEVTVKIEEDVASITSASTGSEVIDWGKNKKNALAFIEVLNEVKLALTPEEIDVKYQELKNNFPAEEEDVLQLPPPTTNKITGFLSVFKPTTGFFFTPILLNLNILIFIIMAMCGVHIFEPDGESLINWGANFRPMTLGGEPWRLVTNCFLHIGIFHLLMNMYALLSIGILLEPLLGRTRYISAYLLTGITASMTSLWWHDLTISAGASGAIFGLYGVFLALLTTDFIEKATRQSLLTSIGIFVGYNLLYGMKGGIDNAAHIGGLIGGLVIGYAFIPSLKSGEANKFKYSTIGLLAVVILASSFVVMDKIPNDLGAYDAKMKEFNSLEQKALAVYHLPQDTPNDKLLYEIKERGLLYWEKSIQLIESCHKLDLPAEIIVQNRLLKEYCELRIKSYELLYKAISENTNQYQSDINEYNHQIEEKLKELEAGK